MRHEIKVYRVVWREKSLCPYIHTVGTYVRTYVHTYTRYFFRDTALLPVDMLERQMS